MDIKKLHKTAIDMTHMFVKGIKTDDWNNQSNCDKWSVRELVNHIVVENWWVPELLAGKTIKEVGDMFEGDMLDGSPIQAYEESSSAAQEAINNLTDINQICHLSFADLPCKEYINQRILDLTVHGWDIAKSTGQPDTFDDDLVAFVYDFALAHRDELRNSGMFGTEIEVDESTDTQTKLLALLGRKR